MTLKTYLFSFYCLLLIFCSCTKKKNPFAKAWFYNSDVIRERYNGIYRYQGVASYHNSSDFLDLRPDSTYTCSLDSFDYGRWYYKDSTFLLVSHIRGMHELIAHLLNDHQMICTDRMNNELYSFDGYNNDFPNASENPFSIQNNLWRKKSDHKESEKEITEKLKNHFRYWEKFFAWGLNTDIGGIDYTTTPGPFNMYGNGFALEYFNNEVPQWKQSFYDTSTCYRAYEKLYYLMVKKDIQWPKTKNRSERFVSAFHQLQDWLDHD